ncbi:hypothetical protein C0W96_11095 [Photobacterium kishitanii]|uniref:DUF2492 domain-containing protein n=1 Tax=Photobacterium kishitanii TaxID=318456 RepID=A0AAX0YZ48_9GAMM|nr:YecH family metal-binding protein [Photobacterium kishitanii]PSV05823.1 hypothetical protein C0W96_11095 [Photobacterium kishitanii]PSV75709.1 hypothetical protein C0W29_10165 [Photobacterium kishitanii]PSX21169.1 hypothetical protein C0W70_02770 [Photobacterium kishitanii]PSX29972.1 hypothetical protein C0W52_01100 [Photobacterium kishitanii]PSX35384.1 hypothetical protein C0W39_02770 [Photobacterium kishitanii]
MSSTESRHGHDVLNLIADASTPFTIKTLHAYVEQHWGADTLFHTCKLNNLSLDTLLTFLLSRNKLTFDGDNLHTNREQICQH